MSLLFAVALSILLCMSLTPPICNTVNNSCRYVFSELATSPRKAVQNASGDVEINVDNFPDATFRSWLQNANNIGGAGADGILTAEEISNITNIVISDSSTYAVADLKGIQYFTALQKLTVKNTLINTLDLSYNTQLTYIDCSFNRLTKVKFANLYVLKNLNCENNYLTELDLSDNSELVWLYCRHNLLSSLDLSHNTKLEFIETFDNRLTQIDVTMLSELTFLHIDHNRLTTLDMSGNLKLEGGGFVVRNNFIETVVLPVIDGFTVYYDDFAEQDPITGYARVAWYLDAQYTIPITSDLQANGQTLYCKRIPNNYTINFDANGGTGAPSQIATEYDQTVNLPITQPTRRGYTFEGWSKYASTTNSDYIYHAGQQVKNLGGDRDFGVKVTLYAQWKGIPYDVAFDANAADATGTMSPISTEYGKSFVLPVNAFSRTDYEFVGWATTPQGKAVYSDRQAVSNLSYDGTKVVLYAVWDETADSVQRPYLNELDLAMDSYDIDSYYTEDWNSLVALCQQTKQQIYNSNKNTSLMRKYVDSCLSSMQKVSNRTQRISEVVEGWRTQYLAILNAVSNNIAIQLGQGNIAYAQSVDAITKADVQYLQQYSSLTNYDSLLDVSTLALQVINEQKETLVLYRDAALWQSTADILLTLNNSDITSDSVHTLQVVLDNYDSLSDVAQSYVASTTLQRLDDAMQLSQAKFDAVLQLLSSYTHLDMQEYCPTCWDNVTQLYNNGVIAVESAQSVQEVWATNEQTVIEMLNAPKQQAPEPEPEPEPQPPEKPETPQSDNTATIVIASVVGVVGVSVAVYLVLKRRKK